MLTTRRFLTIVIALLLVLLAAASVAEPGAGQRLQIDVFDMQSRMLRSITLPQQVSAAGAVSRPQEMPPNPRLLRDPATRNRLLAHLRQQPPGLNVSRATKRLLASRGRGKAVTGTYKMLVLLVDFSDNTPGTYPGSAGPTHYADMLFSTGTYPTGSLVDFYKENSYNQFTVQGTVGGGASSWYRAPSTYAYYVNGEYGEGDYPTNAQKLVEDLVNLADADLDFSQYDNDGDGYVDGVNVVHAGPGADDTGSVDDIWSHQWETNSEITLDGVKVLAYSIMPEDGCIGVFCHEFGHVLGAIDLYDYGYDSAGLGLYTLMAAGSWGADSLHPERPFHFDVWHKLLFGWITPTVPTGNVTAASFPAIETSPTAYKLWRNGDVSGGQYFLVVNRQQMGFDAGLPSGGLAIYHVDESKLALVRPNDQQWFPGQNPANHYAVALEQADGRWDLEHYFNNCDAGDLWADGTNTLRFDRTSTPDSNAYGRGKASYGPSGVSITNISASGATMTADIGVELSGATTWYVKADGSPVGTGVSWETAISAIQPAIDNAADGDTILLAPGVYHENIDFAGKNITVSGTNVTDASVVAATVIAGTANLCTVALDSSETAAARLRGVTVTRTYGSYGPGITIWGASPTVEYCIIRDCYNDGSGSYGGGIFVYSSANPTIRNNTIKNCWAGNGGGIWLWSATATITDNQFLGNRANFDGGAILAASTTSQVALLRNSYRDNDARRGGAIFAQTANLNVVGSTFRGNEAYSFGGAVYLRSSSSGAIANCTLSDNHATRASSRGGALYAYGSSSPAISHLTVDNCGAVEGGGMYIASDCNPTLTNSIITNSPQGSGVYSDHSLSITYCDAYGNTGGNYGGGIADPTGSNGNVSVDPLYAAPDVGNLFLKSRQGRWVPASSSWVRDTVDSPCIDAGDPAAAYNLEPLPNGGRVNMGAWGNTAQASKSTTGSMVQSSTPAQGATGVGRRGPITIVFRWPVVQGSAESHFSLTPSGGDPVTGTFTWTTAFRAMRFQPDTNLEPTTNYTINLASGIRKRDSTTVTWSEAITFRTGSMPIVTAWAPKGTGVPVTGYVRVFFDRDMHRVSTQNNFSCSPGVTGTFSWPSPRELNFRPSTPLAVASTYAVTVGAASRSLAGVAMGTAFSWSFSTAAAAPIVAAASAAPAGDGAQISVSLTAAASVQVSVCNLAGVTISTLPAQALPSGVSTLVWNGRAASGTRVPGGRYFVRVAATAEDGTSASVITPLQR